MGIEANGWLTRLIFITLLLVCKLCRCSPEGSSAASCSRIRDLSSAPGPSSPCRPPHLHPHQVQDLFLLTPGHAFSVLGHTYGRQKHACTQHTMPTHQICTHAPNTGHTCMHQRCTHMPDTHQHICAYTHTLLIHYTYIHTDQTCTHAHTHNTQVPTHTRWDFPGPQSSYGSP